MESNYEFSQAVLNRKRSKFFQKIFKIIILKPRKEQNVSPRLDRVLVVSPGDADLYLRKVPIFLETGWDSSLFWISTPLRSRHLWVLKGLSKTSAASPILSLTGTVVFLSVFSWITFRAMSNLSIFSLCSFSSWRMSSIPPSPKRAKEPVPEYTDELDSLKATQTPMPRFNTHFLIKIPKGLTPDPAWHTTSAKLGSHQPHPLMNRKRHHKATGHT